MYAIIEDGGKQYKVEAGKKFAIEYRDLEAGATIDFDKVVFFKDGETIKVGAPYVAGVKVAATVQGKAFGPKVYPMQFRRRKKSKRRIGHRQSYLEIQITAINN